jgi:PAS domain S-box-containing protein
MHHARHEDNGGPSIRLNIPYVFLFFALFALVVFLCDSNVTAKRAPEAINGVMDLRKWDFKKDGPVDLAGSFAFYWKKQVFPSNFSSGKIPRMNGFMKVPGYWNRRINGERRFPGVGYATYRVKVLLGHQRSGLALRILDIGTAYTIYVSGKKVASAGIAGTSHETTVPRFLPKVVNLDPVKKAAEILFLVSNFHHRRGGIWEAVKLGDREELSWLREKRIGLDLLLLGGIFIIALYNLGLVDFKRRDRSSLYFSVFSLLIGLRLLDTGERPFSLFFPNANWALMTRLEYLSFYLAVPAFCLYLQSLFKGFSKRFLVLVTTGCLGLSGVVILTDARIFTNTLPLGEILMLGTAIYCFYFLIVCWRQGREGASALLFGFVILALAAINDMMYAERLIATGYIVPFVFFIFIFSQSIFLSRRFSKAFTTIEAQQREMKGTLEDYKEEITERREAEKALGESEEKYGTILQSIEDGYYEVDLGGNLTFFNDALCRILGYPREDLMGMNDRKYMSEDTARMVYDTFNEVYRTGKPAKALGWETIRKDGTPRFLETSISLICGSDGEPRGFRGIARDITERKEAENALSESEEKYRTILQSIEDGYYEVDLAGNLTFFNDALCRILGYPREDLMGMNDRKYMSEKTAATVYTTFNKVYRTGIPSKAVGWETIRKDGTRRFLETSISLIRGPDGEPIGFRGIARDITQRKDVEEQARIQEQKLMQASKMVALGTLVSGVAHEVNNPNNFIMLNAPILKEAWNNALPILKEYYEQNGDFLLGGMRYTEIRDSLPRLFSGILDGSERIKRIVEDLKNYVREEPGDMRQSLDVNAVLSSAISLLTNMINKSTNRFVIEYGDDLPVIMGNFQRLEQVLINLIQNACQAIDDKERGIFVSSSFDPAKQEVVILVRDEGSGIPEQALPHITDPFFTTRQDQGGVGLGLSISTKIVEELGGTLRFQSQSSKGTTAEIRLPIDR